MQEFIAKYQDRILGTLSGFDRVIFRGSLRRLNYGWWDGKLQARVALGMEQYLGQNQVSVSYTHLTLPTTERV